MKGYPLSTKFPLGSWSAPRQKILFIPVSSNSGRWRPHCSFAHWDLQSSNIFFPVHFQYLCLDIILSGKSTDRSFYFVLGLCTGMHCLLWDLIKVIDVRVFKIVSNQLNLCLSSILSLMAKAVNIKSHRISF